METPRRPNDSINETFYTPLQRLSAKPINDKNVEADLPRKPPQKIEVDELVPLNKLSVKLSQTKFINTKADRLFSGSGQKSSIYYKAPSSSVDDQFGVQEFLPPVIEKKKYPIIFHEAEPEVQIEGEAVRMEEGPTGDWTSAAVKTALQRQVNTEYEVKRLMRLVLMAGAVKLVGAVASSWWDVRRADTVVLVLIGLNLVGCMWRLCRSQDQCKDLPLSNRQRELIGLKPLDDNVYRTADKPKYSKFAKKPVPEATDPQIELNYKRRAPAPIEAPHPHNEHNQRIFRRNLNLKF